MMLKKKAINKHQDPEKPKTTIENWEIADIKKQNKKILDILLRRK